MLSRPGRPPIEQTMMIRSTLLAAALGVLAGLPALCLFTAPARQEGGALPIEAVAGKRSRSRPGRSARRWTFLAEGPAWAPLDPDFAAGKRALAAGDWNGAITALTSAGLRDDRNADIQNYLGYAYRRLRQIDRRSCTIGRQ